MYQCLKAFVRRSRSCDRERERVSRCFFFDSQIWSRRKGGFLEDGVREKKEENQNEKIKTNLRQKPIELNDGTVPSQDLELVTASGATPLGLTDVGGVQGEGIAATRRLPAQTGVGETAFARAIGEVEVDVVEALPLRRVDRWVSHLLLSSIFLLRLWTCF